MARNPTAQWATGIVATVAGWPLARVASPTGPVDAVVVVGAPLTHDHQLSAVLEERIAHGVAAWRSLAAPILCVSGGGRGPVAEAEVLGLRARELGVPAAALRIEATSLTTEENARHTHALLASEGVRRICVVTQRFHLRRTGFLFSEAGFDVCGYQIEGGLQASDPRRALRWMGREYAAWVRLASTRIVGRRRRG